MIINRLDLTHYRGATNLSLAFNKKLNVLCGINGAGKSTVLDSLAILLSWAISRIRHINAPGRPVNEDDITNGESWSALQLSCFERNETVHWRLMKSRAGHNSPDAVKSDFGSLNGYAKDLQVQIARTGEQTNIPLFVYYPVNRAVLDIPLRIRKKHPLTLLTAYDDALDSVSSGANFRTFFEWFREREDLENEYRKYQDDASKPDGYQFPDVQLEAVRSALMQFMPEFSNLTVRRNPLRMTVEKCGQRLNVNQLSDGEKCMIALIGDLARRLAIANPMRTNPLEGDGIVLIDEVDLHLHPKWQRIVVPKLQDVFVGCQFILSTHSPHVIAHVKPESLFLIRQTPSGIISEKPNESYGKNVDRVLEDLMGVATRPDAVDSGLRSVFRTIDRGQLDAARTQIDTLRKLIGDDPDLVKADVLIRRKEIIGK